MSFKSPARIGIGVLLLLALALGCNSEARKPSQSDMGALARSRSRVSGVDFDELPACEPALRALSTWHAPTVRSGLLAPKFAADVDTIHELLTSADCIDLSVSSHLPRIAALSTSVLENNVGTIAEFVAAAEYASRSSEALEKTLTRLYPAATAPEKAGLDLNLPLSVALFDYARLVREEFQGTLSTEVTKLKSTAFCAGDVFGSHLLVKYFRTAVDGASGSVEAEVEATAALHHLSHQVACLSERQLFEFDQALSFAWEGLESRLAALNVAKALIPQLEPFVLQVRLLVLDATKHFGSESPGINWMRTRQDLRRRIRDEAVAPFHRHVWLYDRRTGTIVAIKTQCDDGGSGEKCMSLSVLVDSLVHPEALGFGECSLLEMVEAGVRQVRGAPVYTCTPGVCGTPASGQIADTSLGLSFLEAYRVGSGYHLPNRRTASPFGVALGELEAALCGPNSGGGLGGKGGSAGLGARGMGPANEALACVVGAKARATSALVPGLSCMGRYVQATGSLEKAFERMGEVNYAGIPDGCELSDAGHDEAQSDHPKEQAANLQAEVVKAEVDKLAKALKEQLNTPEWRKALKEAAEKRGINLTEKDIDSAFDALSNATVAPLGKNEKSEERLGATDLDGKITVDPNGFLKMLATSGKKGVSEGLVDELVHSALSRFWKNLAAQGLTEGLKAVRNETDHGIRGEVTGTTNRHVDGGHSCVRGGGLCSTQCNGLSVQVREALSCLDDAFNPATIPPTPTDLVTDPIEPEHGGAHGFASCVKSGGDQLSVIVAEQCSNVLCADSNSGLANGSCCQLGGALNSSGMSGRHQDMCLVAHCQSSASLGALDTCGCGGSTPAGGQPPMPPGHLAFPPL